MSHIEDELAQHPPLVPFGGHMQGQINRAPTNVGQRASVVLRQLAQAGLASNLGDAARAQFDVLDARWEPRVEISTDPITAGEPNAVVKFPAKGDVCLVAIDDFGEAWIVAWWPYS